jgi:hypothetical protein
MAEYVERVAQASVTGSGYLDNGDTPAFAGIYEAAARVVGTVLQAVADLINGGTCRAAPNASRPFSSTALRSFSDGPFGCFFPVPISARWSGSYSGTWQTTPMGRPFHPEV